MGEHGDTFTPGPGVAAQLLEIWEHLPAEGEKEAE